ncbi:MAG: single-stranded DNA-binding protein [Muribaculaceae bacterium]|nr:single-stranded DNA-binding protein [Muribaculaceae bacterium]
MNKVILCGNVGVDPTMRMVENRPMAAFTLATTERRRGRDADGKAIELPPLTEWHHIVMWGTAAEYAEKYIRTGSKLLVEGKLRTRRWTDRNALEHSRTEIHVDSFELLPKGN